MLTEVNDNSIEEEVYRSNRPVFVAFLADWCWVCDKFRPELEAAAHEMKDVVKFCFVNIDRSPDSKAYFGIDGTPRSILFDDGREVATLRGGWPTADVLKFISENLGGDRAKPTPA